MRRALAAAGRGGGAPAVGLLRRRRADFVPGPGPAKIDVDTPELRELKQEAGVEACAPGAGEPVDGGLPAVTLPCLGGGQEVDLARCAGPLVVNLWASWCGPCRQEMPVLEDFHEQYGDRVPVLGIDSQDPQTAARWSWSPTRRHLPAAGRPRASLERADAVAGPRGLPVPRA